MLRPIQSQGKSGSNGSYHLMLFPLENRDWYKIVLASGDFEIKITSEGYENFTFSVHLEDAQSGMIETVLKKL